MTMVSTDHLYTFNFNRDEKVITKNGIVYGSGTPLC